MKHERLRKSPLKGDKSYQSPKGEIVSKKNLHCVFCYKMVLLEDDKDILDTFNIEGKTEIIKRIDFEPDENKEEKENKRLELCARFYCHVVSPDKYKTKSKSREVEASRNLLRNNCGVCDDCYYVIENHCNVYREVEYLKLRLRWQLDKFHKVMKFAGKVPTRMKAFRESFNLEVDSRKSGSGSRIGGIVQEREKEFTEIMGFRKRIYTACTKRLQVINPKVVLSPFENSVVSRVSPGKKPIRRKLSYENENNDDISVTQQIQEQEVLANLDQNIPCAMPSDDYDDILYIIKADDIDENEDCRRFVTPPESIIETLRTGEVHNEGVSKNHYFYCTPDRAATPPGVVDTMTILSTPSTIVGDDILSENRSNLSEASGGTPRQKDNKVEPPIKNLSAALDVFQCIKCKTSFPNEYYLKQHARLGGCFTNDNIDLSRSPPKPEQRSDKSQNDSSTPTTVSKRKRSSPENMMEENVKKHKQISDGISETGSSHMEKHDTGKVSSNNVLTSAVDKVLHGLRSTFKCTNCSETFPNEEKFKSHVISRVCFRKIEKRASTSKGANRNNGGEVSLENENDDSDSDDDSTSLSASSHEDSSSDSDYAPRPNERKPKKTKNRKSSSGKRKKAKVKQVVKKSCPRENCDKFFLYQEDLESHLKQHAKFSCEFCSYTTDLTSKIVYHEIQSHAKTSSSGNLMCPRCPGTKIKVLSFDKLRQIQHYLRRHLTQEISQ